ncbi:hypothetical protein CEXT_396691 [Caerostris extrusa]|uniref:Uncharacterized protein n=1 Tax=Caerostris extrusa TaxID=172846 RepID=A0AAV4T6I7_CAEEX|nr:hypothetical protein CEXT_396691 [Caerostris extrusa]
MEDDRTKNENWKHQEIPITAPTHVIPFKKWSFSKESPETSLHNKTVTRDKLSDPFLALVQSSREQETYISPCLAWELGEVQVCRK